MASGFQLKPAILIVSDTAAADPSTDRSAPVLRDVFASEAGSGKWTVPEVKIVGDDIEGIREAVKRWTDSDDAEGDLVNLVITTGGTGFAKRDFTPEAITPLLHRHAPGLVHGMLAASLEVTPFAMMSRPVAGVRNKTLLVTLPGSPKGARENLEAILKLLPHACMQAAGVDSRSLHAGGVQKLEREAGVSASGGKTSANHDHSHHHHHDHGHGGHQVPKPHTTPSERPPQSNDPSAGPTQRHRSSPYPMLSVSEAIDQIITHSPDPQTTTLPLSSPQLIGSTVSSPIHAKEAVPAYRASIVDGYAIVVDPAAPESTKGTFPVASVSHAQANSIPPPLEPGTIARITTGAPLPSNANAVVMVEDTALISSKRTTLPDGTTTLEESTVEVLTSALKSGENIREPGSDIPINSLLLSPGTLITPIGGEIGVLAASGAHTVPVFSKPSIGVLSTGDEVVDSLSPSPSSSLHGGQIRDSNRPSLLSLLTSWNLCSRVVDLGIARDTPPGTLETFLRSALRTHDLDIIVTTGGVSMGELDLLKPTIERSLGGTIHFGRVSMKPGKPTTFASIPFKDSGEGRRGTRLVFGLPGNPASALVTASLFLLPSLQKMAGQGQQRSKMEKWGLPRVKVTVTHDVRADPQRTEYHRVVVSAGEEGGLVAKSTGMQRSSRVGSLAGANGLLVVAEGSSMKKGETGTVLMMGGIVGL